MDKDDKCKTPNFDVYDTTAKILGQHGKSDDEIKTFLAEQFPISSAIMEKIFESRKKGKSQHK